MSNGINDDENISELRRDNSSSIITVVLAPNNMYLVVAKMADLDRKSVWKLKYTHAKCGCFAIKLS